MHLRVVVRATAFLGASLVVACSGVFAGIILSDDFNKANGPLLGTAPNTGTGNWTITGTSVVNPIQISGNAVALQSTGQDAYVQFASSAPNPGDGSQLHTSMDINLSAAGTGDYFTHLSDPAGTTTNFYQRLGAASTTGGYFLTLAATAGGGATTTTGTTVLNLNQTYHVDEYWTFNPGTNSDTITVNVNNVPYLSKTWDSSNPEPTQLSAANFRQGTTGAAATLTVDNLQVETIAVPEPGTFVLLALGCCVLGGRRRSS